MFLNTKESKFFRVFRVIRSFTEQQPMAGCKTPLRGEIFAETTKYSYLCKRNHGQP